jgi:hypothetical protein
LLDGLRPFRYDRAFGVNREKVVCDMKMRSAAVVVGLWGAVGFLAGCGESNRSSGATALPVAVATPTPAPSPTPVATEPSHAPAPPPCEECEAPVTNTNTPVRLTIRVYKVEDLDGKLVTGYTTEFPVGYKVTIDATAKDEDNHDTLGSTDVRFGVSDDSLVRIGGNHNFQRKITAVRAGDLRVWAALDGVDSNILDLSFTN